MNTDLTPPAPTTPPTIRMDTLTLKAAKLICGLSKIYRRSVFTMIQGPILLKHCKQVAGLGQLRVWRIRVNRTLRVTFREVDGSQCILHAGTHPDADRFVEHYRGELPAHLIPIQEFNTMAKNLMINSNGGADGKKSAKPVGPKPETDDHRKLGSEAELLTQVISLIADKAMEEKKRQLVGEIEAVDELIRGQEVRIAGLVRRQESGEQSMAEQVAQFAEQARRFQEEVAKGDRIAKDFGVRLGEMNTGLGKRAIAVEGELAGLAKSLGQLEAAHQDQTLRCLKKNQKLEQCLAEFSGQLRQIADSESNRVETTNVVERRIQVIESQVADSVTAERRLRQAEACVASIDTRTERLDSDVRDLAASVAALRRTVDQQATQPQRLGFVSTILRLFRPA